MSYILLLLFRGFLLKFNTFKFILLVLSTEQNEIMGWGVSPISNGSTRKVNLLAAKRKLSISLHCQAANSLSKFQLSFSVLDSLKLTNEIGDGGFESIIVKTLTPMGFESLDAGFDAGETFVWAPDVDVDVEDGFGWCGCLHINSLN